MEKITLILTEQSVFAGSGSQITNSSGQEPHLSTCMCLTHRGHYKNKKTIHSIFSLN